MAKRKSDLIEMRQGAGAKSAYIRDTRVRVADIAVFYGILLDELVIERLQRTMPHLSTEEISAAIEYWRTHKREIERELEEEEEALANIPSAW